MSELRINLDVLPRAIGVAVSAGADSVALLRWLASHHSSRLVVIHFNHQLRGQEADADEQFVRDLAASLGLPALIRRRSALDSSIPLPANPSARYRAMRLTVYREAIATHGLDAVALAHHAEDQAETILLRLVRGGGLAALCGMRDRTTIAGVPVVRPMLQVRRDALRTYLQSINQSWREDASNASSRYRRNVARQAISNDPALVEMLCTLAANATQLRIALDRAAPALDETFDRHALQVPSLLAEHAARRWLTARGAPADDVSSETCQRLIDQAIRPDAPARQHYPGGLFVRRRAKRIFVDTPTTPAPVAPDPTPQKSA